MIYFIGGGGVLGYVFCVCVCSGVFIGLVCVYVFVCIDLEYLCADGSFKRRVFLFFFSQICSICDIKHTTHDSLSIL